MAGKLECAMVLCAGLGTRMANRALPKPLVLLHGKALIDHVLDRLGEAGIERAVVNLHHKADLIERHVSARKVPAITFSYERETLLDTGGGVKKALPLLGPGPFLIQNADSVWIEGIGSNLGRLMDAWDDARMDCLMMLALSTAGLGYQGRGDFAMDSEGRIRRRLVEQEIVPFAFTGVSVAHPRLFKESPEGAFSLNLV
ncbi:MAG TPA: nucleotidyltransferase family protein, partial [Hyphomicrobiaceae bacterium]|nr:nucleotidyltransferase family protein [Hyphomicrobiaceae bacterium]